MRATIAYTGMRLLLFIVALIVLYLLGARAFWLVGLALLISGVMSLLLLSRQRDAMSGALASSVRSFRTRLDEGSRSEDED